MTTDPLALAEEIEPSKEPGAYCAQTWHPHVRLHLTEADARLLAAALRLAEAVTRHVDCEYGDSLCPACDGFDDAPRRHNADCTFDAYRKARGEG